MNEAVLSDLPLTGLVDWKASLADALHVLQQAYAGVDVLHSDALAAFVAGQDDSPLDEAIDALGQELSAHLYALYSVDTGDDGYNFVLLHAAQQPAPAGVYRFSDAECAAFGIPDEDRDATTRLCHQQGQKWGRKNSRSRASRIRLWDSVRNLGMLNRIGDAQAAYWSRDTRADMLVDLRKWGAADADAPAGYDQYGGQDRVALTGIQRSAGGQYAALGCARSFTDIRMSDALDARAEAWKKPDSLGDYTDQDTWFAAFEWLGAQLIVLSRKRFQTKGRPQKTFVLRYDAHGHLLQATELAFPDTRTPPGGHLVPTGDGRLYVFCGDGAWEITADDVRRVEHLPPDAIRIFCAEEPCSIGAHELCCFVQRAGKEALKNDGQQMSLYLLDMQTGKIRQRRLDDLGIPHGVLPEAQSIIDGWVLFSLFGDGLKRQHAAVLWNTRTDAFHAIPFGSFGREAPAFFYVPSLRRLFATVPGTTWRCLPWDEFLTAVQSDPKLQLQMPPWETAFQNPWQ